MSSDLKIEMEAVVGKLNPNMQELGKQYIKSLLEAKVNSFEALLAAVQDQNFDIEVRRIACWALGQLRDKRAIKALLIAFRDENVSLRWESAKVLGIIGSKRAVRPLITSLLEAESVESRTAAAYALGFIGDKRALDPLLHVLLNHKEEAKVRGEAAEALALLRDTRAVVPLIECLKDDSPEVRFWSAYALGELGDKKALPELERLATIDEAVLPEWGKISNEAASAIESIQAKSKRI